MLISTNFSKAPTLTALVILDGFGISQRSSNNAIFHAKTPTLNYLQTAYSYTTLKAAEEAVGLPKTYMGNSEVGHVTIGSGRIVPQSLTALNTITHPHNLITHTHFNHALTSLTSKNRVHIIGMLSDKGVHSHINHLKNILQTILNKKNIEIILHFILDGRDALPKSACSYIETIKKNFTFANITIGSVHGRFYAMDRDNNQERTSKSGKLFIHKQKPTSQSPESYIQEQYVNNMSDEFIKPQTFIKNHTINKDDLVIFTNFRVDRITQLAQYIQQYAQPHTMITAVPYTNVKSHVLHEPKAIQNGLLETLNKNKKMIFSIAETEKLAHISYFFNGGKKQIFEHETRICIPSKKETSYEHCPEMSAQEITNTVLESLRKNPKSFYLINYANADMVGHSGNFDATVQAIEYLDQQIKQLYQEIVIKQKGTLFITADHGNAELMFNEKEQQKNRAHTTNPVPFYAINTEISIKKMQGLKDISPCILKHFDINIPEDMSSEDFSSTCNSNKFHLQIATQN